MTMENGFASARADAFPAGLRVLVVDDDITWLKVLEKMLKKCSYEVTTCCLAIDALNILRERKDGFDIVISDVNMPDMDGFKLLEHVGLEMDLPVIMMSVDGETSRVMKGVQHGACDYLLKPVRMKELKNIWQHVFRKKIHEVKDIESHEVNEDIPSILKQGSEKFEDGYLLSGGILNLAKKRKDTENKEHDNNQDLSDPSSAKKARVVWTVDLHQKFVNAVNQIGIDKVGPKKILDLMNIPWLTRENVASHLQKYRLYLSRLEKESEPQACFVGLKQTDFTPKDPSARFGLQCSIIIHQNNTPCSTFGYSSGETLVQPMDPKIGEDDLKGIIPVVPVPETRNALNTNLHENPKRSNGSQIDFTGSVGTLNCASFDSSTRSQKHQWNGEIGDVQFKQQTEPKNKLYVHTHPLLAAPSINPVASIAENDKSNSTGTNPLSNGHRSNHATNISALGSTTGSYPIQTETRIANIQASGPGCAITESSSVKDYCFDHNSVSTWESEQKNLIGGTGTVLQSAENLHLCSLQDYGYTENTVLNSIEFLDYHDLELFAAVPNQSCERMKLNCDYLYESVDYPVMDQGLFIA